MKKRNRIIAVMVLLIMTVTLLAGCDIAAWKNKLNNLSGSIKGNTYECQFFTNSGELFMTAEGENINITPNIVEIIRLLAITDKAQKIIPNKRNIHQHFVPR